MWTELLLTTALFWYLLTPGDNTGRPYPTTEEEIRIELELCNEWLNNTECEFERIKAHRDVVVDNEPIAEYTRKVELNYLNKRSMRRSIQYRINNLKKLLRKYEHINSKFDCNNSAPGSVGSGTTPQDTMAVDDRTTGNTENQYATIDLINALDACPKA